MPTRALGALLAAVAAALFVVSIVTAAWWDGHPRVSGHVMTAKDVHIGLLGGSGCNTGGTGECQPVELGSTFTTAAYGELGAVGLATAFAILVMGAAWRISDGRKRIAKLALITATLAAGGAVALLVIGPQIKSSVAVEVPIGWGMLVFGGGIAASLIGSLVTMRVEREPLRLKTTGKPAGEPAFDVREILREQHDGLRPTALGPEPMMGPGASGNLPGPAGPLGAPLVPGAPQLRPLYDHQGAIPAPAAPVIPHRAPTPLPRASAHALAGLPTPPPELDRAPSFAETAERRLESPSAFAETADRRLASPSQFEATADLSRSKPVTAPPPPPPFVPAAAPYERAKPPPIDRPKPPTAPPPFAGRARPPTPFANPAIEPNVRIKSPSTAPPSRPSVPPDASVDPLGKTVPAPSRPGPRPSVPLPAKKPPVAPKTAPLPTPTPSLITSAAKPEPGKPATRASQPTLAHAVPPMPQIDTPPPQLRAPTESDDRLETAMRETEIVTAVEIDHEAKARYEESRRQSEGRAETATGMSEPPEAEPTGVSEPPQPELPRTTSEERAAIHDEGLAAHAYGDVPGDDTDALETAARERMDADGIDPVAPPPAKPEAVKPPLSTAPASLPPPKTATLPVSGPTPACPQCESPMAWVEEHLRFYCKSCRMYF